MESILNSVSTQLTSSPFQAWQTQNNSGSNNDLYIKTAPFSLKSHGLGINTKDLGHNINNDDIEKCSDSSHNMNLFGLDLSKFKIELSPSFAKDVQKIKSKFNLLILIHNLVEDSIIFLTTKIQNGTVPMENSSTCLIYSNSEVKSLLNDHLYETNTDKLKKLNNKLLNHCIGCLIIGYSIKSNLVGSDPILSNNDHISNNNHNLFDLLDINGPESVDTYLKTLLEAKNVNMDSIYSDTPKDSITQTKQMINMLVQHLNGSTPGTTTGMTIDSTNSNLSSHTSSTFSDFHEDNEDNEDNDTTTSSALSSPISKSKSKSKNDHTTTVSGSVINFETLSTFSHIHSILLDTSSELEVNSLSSIQFQSKIKSLQLQYEYLHRQYDHEHLNYKKIVSDYKLKCDQLEQALNDSMENLNIVTKQIINSESEVNKLHLKIDNLSSQLSKTKSKLLQNELDNLGNHLNVQNGTTISGVSSPSSLMEGILPSTPLSTISVSSDCPSPSSASTTAMVLRHEFRKLVSDLNKKHKLELIKEQSERKKLEQQLMAYKKGADV